ncbi:MAG: hypothetical protein M3Z04_10955 [Chloroflexota bacterium]|nr:hypothetical protein [Chloroflexota bacterium]
MAEEHKPQQVLTRAVQRTDQSATRQADRGAVAPVLPQRGGLSLTDPRLAGRGNGPVRVALMRQAQRTQGNRAVQRLLQRMDTAGSPASLNRAVSQPLRPPGNRPPSAGASAAVQRKWVIQRKLADGGGGGGACVAAPQSAAADPKFQAVTTKVKTTATGEKAHLPAKSKADEAQAAAQSPPNEVPSRAEARQTDKMAAQKPGRFDREGFMTALLGKINSAAPKTLEDAQNFKGSGKLGAMKGDLTGKVGESKHQAQGPVADEVKKAPDTGGIAPKSVTPLPTTNAGPAPAAPQGADAAPKEKGDCEVRGPLDANSKALDSQLTESHVTAEQLQKSNEGTFTGALKDKKEAQTDAQTAPSAYRQGEKGILTQAQTQAQKEAGTGISEMHGVRGHALGGVGGKQGTAKQKDEAARAKVATDIQGIYGKTKTDVEARLTKLDTDVNSAFDGGVNGAMQNFENTMKTRFDAYYNDRYSTPVVGALKWGKDKLFGPPAEVNAFYDEGKRNFETEMRGVLNRVADVVEKGMNEALARIETGKKQIQDYVKGLDPALQKVGVEAAKDIQSQFEELESGVNEKQSQLIDSLADKYKSSLDTLNTRIDAMKEANKGLYDRAKDAITGVIKTILELKNLLMGVLARAAGAIEAIIADPIKFLGNLVAAVKQGLGNFMSNIGAHLQKGLLGWLFGALGDAGIELPASFDLKGILSLVMQVVGLTYANIRGRAVKAVGEPTVRNMEKSVDIFKVLASEGPAGLWRFIKDKIGDLKDTVIEGIKNFVIERIVVAGITWLVSLFNPAGAFIKACKAIYDVIMFFIERGSQIMALVNAVLNSVSAIASGSVGGAAAAIEGALSAALPVAISFLANLLGLGGISEKIKSIIGKVRAPVEKAVDWVIGKAVAGLKKVGGLFTGKGKGKGSDPSKDAAKGTAPGQDAAQDKGKGDQQNQDPDGKNVKAEVRSDLAGKLQNVGTAEEVKSALNGTFQKHQKEGLKKLYVQETNKVGEFGVYAVASPAELVGKMVTTKLGIKLDHLNLAKSVATALNARVNTASLGRFESLAGTHAEENLLRILNNYLDETIPNSQDSHYEISVDINRSPCEGCGPKLQEFLAKKRKFAADHGKTIGLTIRMISAYKGAPKGSPSYVSLQNLNNAGVNLEAWDVVQILEASGEHDINLDDAAIPELRSTLKGKIDKMRRILAEIKGAKAGS